jgi:hypothetical protein
MHINNVSVIGPVDFSGLKFVKARGYLWGITTLHRLCLA